MFTVRELPRAKLDKRHIFEWLIERSPQGAAAWLDAYDQMINRLSIAAPTLPAAEEAKDLAADVRQVLFKTNHGRTYRAVFLIDDEYVYVLRVRGPGQAPVGPNELAE